MGNYIGKIVRILSISLFLFLFPALAPAKVLTLEQHIDQKIKNMSLETKVGQLFIVGFPGTKMTPDLKAYIHSNKPGSFILFKRNIKSADQIRSLNKELYSLSYQAAGLPPLLAIDQEGGQVSRLPIDPPQPSAFVLGKTQAPLLVEEIGYQTALFLRAVGFNMNLAPVLDVSDPLLGGFIGVRSFGSSPTLVSEMGTSFSKGLLRAKVIPTAKHFPGTGNIAQDPHKDIVVNSDSKEHLLKTDIAPFTEYAKLGEHTAVMLSHLVYPALDPVGEPASFSSAISKDLLRGQLKYKGLVVTDDLQMQGSKLLLKPEEAALKSLMAGADLVMLTWSYQDQIKAFKRVKSAVESGQFSESELDQKLHRILTVKALTHSFKEDGVLKSKANFLSSKEYERLEDEVLISNLNNNLQTKQVSMSSRRAIASAPFSSLCAVSSSSKFLSSFKAISKWPTKYRLIKSNSSPKDLVAWEARAKCSAMVISVIGPHASNIVGLLPLDLKKKSVVINLGAPSLISSENDYRAVIQLNFFYRNSGRRVAENLERIFSASSGSYARQ